MAGSRASTASSYTIIKGAVINETYDAFRTWDFTKDKKENLDRLVEENLIGAKSAGWLRDVRKVLNRRFDPEGRDRPLVTLAKHDFPVAEWKPILLWHITRDEFLLRDFLEELLFSLYEQGAIRVDTDDVKRHVSSATKRGAIVEGEWSDNTLARTSAGLLKMAVDFGLLKGSVTKEFAGYHLPERSFLYILHAMSQDIGNPHRIVHARAWRMYLMRSADVEQELLRLHQYRKLQYERAGTISHLDLPYANAQEFAEKMAA